MLSITLCYYVRHEPTNPSCPSIYSEMCGPDVFLFRKKKNPPKDFIANHSAQDQMSRIITINLVTMIGMIYI